MKMQRFDYNRFLELRDSELANYVEPLLDNRAEPVPTETLERMLSELPQYDDQHLVYALLLGVDRAPTVFAQYLPQFLSHDEGAVRCTAINLLVQLPDEHVSLNLVNSVERALLSPATKPMV